MRGVLIPSGVVLHASRVKRLGSGRKHLFGFFCGARHCHATTLQEASGALRAAAVTPRVNLQPEEMRQAAARLLDTHEALNDHERAEWWAHVALEEEDRQLDELSRALPRGGRIAPQLLDVFVPATPTLAEVAFQTLVNGLGGAGLAGALRLRAAARVAAAEFRLGSSSRFALERLDRRLQATLKIWLSSGLLQVQRLNAASPSEQRTAATAMAIGTVGQTIKLPAFDGDDEAWYRCFILIHPGMATTSSPPPPLLIAHASLLTAPPGNLAEAVGGLAVNRGAPSTPDGRLACIWAIGGEVSGLVPCEALRGLGLGQFFRREVTLQLQKESLEVSALIHLNGLTSILYSQKVWEVARATRILDEHGADVLRCALGVGDAPETIEFVDEDGDQVRFRKSVAIPPGLPQMEVILGTSKPRIVSRLIVAEDGRALRFLMQPGDEGLQVNAPNDVVADGCLLRVELLAASCGLLPTSIRDPVLRLAYECLLRHRRPGTRFLSDPLAHFHLLGGAALRALHWEADKSRASVASSFGIMATFTYEGGPETLVARAAAYIDNGEIAMIGAGSVAL